MATKVCLKPASERSSPPREDSLRPDLLFCATIALIVLIFFAPTALFGEPISRICRLANWDSLFSAYASRNNGLMDPSAVQLMIPYYFVVAKSWHMGQIPLWNPFSGCGVPLIGDIQSEALSPVTLLLSLWPSMYMYNAALVLKVAVAGIATFGLSRSLGLSRWPSLFAAVTFTFCPFILFFLELQLTGYCWHPLVYWMFVRAARRPTLARSFSAGAACAVLVLAGHPEVSFVGIVFACMLAALIVLFPERRTDGGEPVTDDASPGAQESVWRRLMSLLKIVGVAGITAFCLSAPVLLPFGEYLLNADCYKFQQAGGNFSMPWKSLGLSMMHPTLGGASPFLGCVAAILLPVALISRRRSAIHVILLAGLCFSIVCSLWPMSFIMSHKPFTFLHAVYCVQELLLLSALAAAFGFDELVLKRKDSSRMTWLVGVLVAAFVCIVPWYLRYAHVPLARISFDPSIPQMDISSHAWTRELLLMITFAALVVVAMRLRRVPLWIVAVACIICGFVSQGSIAKMSLPVQAKFDYPMVEPLKMLQESGQRSVGIGAHVLKPNTGAVYGVADVRTHNPLFPKRYLSFMRESGASLDSFNQIFETPLKPLVDVAATRYVLSALPVRATGDSPVAAEDVPVKIADAICFGPDIKLTAAKVRYEHENSECWGNLAFETRSTGRRRYSYSLVWLDDSDNLVWYGDQQRFARGQGHEWTKVDREIAVPVSLAHKPGSALRLGIQVFDWHKISFLKPSTWASVRHPNIAILEQITVLPRNSGGPGKFHLVSETQRGVRVYENRAAIPRAHVVHDAILVNSEASALEAIKDPSFNPQRQAVIEGNSSDLPEGLPGGTGPESGRSDLVKVERNAANEVQIKVEQSLPGLLVLSDTYYPGWIAKVDGREVPILRTNYLFRGIAVPAGEHQVEFLYVPLSFWLGVALCAGGIGVGLFTLMAASSRLRARKTRPDSSR